MRRRRGRDLLAVLAGRSKPEGKEEKWFRKTNVPGSLFVAELKDPPEGREMAGLSRDREVEKPAK